MNALIIDDDIFLKKAVSFLLLDLDHTVATANTTREAMTLIEEGRDFDLVFCDAVMPGLTSPEFLVFLKKHYRQHLPRVIMISSAPNGKDILKARNIEYDYFVKKPVDMDDLRELIAHIQETKNKSITLQ